MVPNLSKGAGIKGTALYVLHDKRTEEERAIGDALAPELQSQQRIGMTATRNLSTDDPELAWRLMCATAANRDALKEAAGIRAGGRQTKNFCGHLSLSWELGTRPDASEMRRAADGALKALGWEKLQALVVEHRDEEHAHCHVVVCLIDPETGRTAPNAKNDYEKVQRWAHAYDKERGIEACPDRAARMERAPDDPSPAAPAKRWLSRKEYEALQKAERAETKAQALARYQAAAAEVREQFRPEWAALYKEQRAELRTFDRTQSAIMRKLDQAARVRTTHVRDAGEKGWVGPAVTVRDRLAAFVNEHRDEIWRGIGTDNQPGSTHTLLNKAFLKGALERGQELDRELLLMRHDKAREALQGRHTEARQEAYRAAWQRPAEPKPEPEKRPSDKQPQPANSNTQVASDPERDLQAAAARIDRHRRSSEQRAQSGDREPPRDPPTDAPAPSKAGEDRGGGGARANPQQDEVAALRQRLAREDAAMRERWRAASARERGIGRDRGRD